MSTEQTSVEPTDDLDLFSADFFGQKKAEPEPAKPEEDDGKEGSDAHTDDGTQPSEDDDTLDEDDNGKDNPDEDEDSGDKNPPKKKNRFQERIDELTGKAREAERREAALKAELEEIRKKLDKNEPELPTKPVEVAGPSPDDKNEDGTDKYPLGEFDPNFIRDLTKFTLEEERRALKAKEAEETQQRQLDEQRAQLETSWREKLGPAQERYPDFQEKGSQLIESFPDLNPAYGEYLTATIMGMDYGPDVLYYLANNPDEAKKIVESGPTKATIALGRIESKFLEAEEEKKKTRTKVSKAPTPPPTNKGLAAAHIDIPDDTDDLDAFTKKLFPK